ncbi:MAG: DUF192 domain-containing protein [Candidatus Eremiobacteraeota bacterium]|nr:DUF192 domain-containing protein [Candidatus Eremiobacteraeota bacterium]MBC5801581.1 DUF192 domain-containing protein [Candidatus Eremiobacteraeota bacterium]MBC5821702.1 DUF192 domain-containing protein [Candidatus Eremiobacteraeota bacterium]
MAKAFVLHNRTSGDVLASRVRRAADPLARGIGLLARARVAADEGVWIGGCSAVHTLGMRATIDLYFLDRDGCVMKIVPAVSPGRLSVSCRGAKNVVELGAAGDERPVRLGDRLALE